MTLVRESLARQCCANAGVRAGGKAHKVLCKQGLLVKACFQVGREAHRQIHITGCQSAAAVGGRFFSFNDQAGRGGLKMVDKPGQQHDFADVGHADSELARGLPGQESLGGAARFVQSAKRFNHIGVDGLGSGRGRHAGGCATKKRVIKMPPQLG